MYEVEKGGLHIYKHIVHAIISFERRDANACWIHVQAVNTQFAAILKQYYNLMHEERIQKSVWMRYVQGFFGWGLQHPDLETEASEKHDGLSGNQAMLFPVIDAFLGLPPYLDSKSRDRNIPKRQRDFIDAVERYCFRKKTCEFPAGQDGAVASIQVVFASIVKQMKVR